MTWDAVGYNLDKNMCSRIGLMHDNARIDANYGQGPRSKINVYYIISTYLNLSSPIQTYTHVYKPI